MMELENKIKRFTFLTDQPKMNHFCSTDEEFRFFTRFASEEMFMLFWESVALSASRIIYWTKAQREAYGTLSPHRKLPINDECFLFLCRIVGGLKEKALASVFKVSLSTVSRIITTWMSYCYLVLGSQPSWMTRQQVQVTMPKKFRWDCLEVHVLIDCTELYTGSISDQEITLRSNFTRLLQPGDGVMADKLFQTERMLAEVGATLIIPPFKRSAQFSKEDA
ncbi:hypothetical protein SRHO_G00079590 [Serrasalmus rhombeus]